MPRKKPDTTSYDLIVVGGGASGMMAAGRAAARGKRVLLIEKNPTLGAKLSITGGGRCNITNAEEDIHAFLKHYEAAAPFLYSPFSQFGMKDTFSFFESRGLPLVTQARKRVFPQTERAPDVTRTLIAYMAEGGVTVRTNTRVTEMVHERTSAGRYVVRGVRVGTELFRAPQVLLATGGLSHPETGSTGDGFGWLRQMGHTVKKPTPTVVPLRVRDAWVKELSGVSLSFMRITFFLDGKKSFSKMGKILFTHFGISSPLILNSAGKVAELLKHGTVTATIDAYPDTDHKLLDERIRKIFDQHKNKFFKTILPDVVPAGMASTILPFLSHITPETKVHSITKEGRRELVNLLKSLPLTITGLMGVDRAVVMDGGIPLTEIDTRTMRSKVVDGLMVTGDLLHITRPSGGYSLQLCWTTGWVAGSVV
jgi:predicted Rossmann fold flavoprotein